MFLPSTSSAVQPNIRSAAGLNEVIRPWRSMTTTAAGTVSSTERRWSLTAAARRRVAWNQPPPTAMPKPTDRKIAAQMPLTMLNGMSRVTHQTAAQAKVVANTPGPTPPSAALINTAGTNSRNDDGAVKASGGFHPRKHSDGNAALIGDVV